MLKSVLQELSVVTMSADNTMIVYEFSDMVIQAIIWMKKLQKLQQLVPLFGRVTLTLTFTLIR